MHESTLHRLSIAAAILLLFSTSLGNAQLMLAVSAIVIITGLFFYSGKMKLKMALTALIGFAVAIILSRFILI